jgi:hypothetical protein
VVKQSQVGGERKGDTNVIYYDHDPDLPFTSRKSSFAIHSSALSLEVAARKYRLDNPLYARSHAARTRCVPAIRIRRYLTLDI